MMELFGPMQICISLATAAAAAAAARAASRASTGTRGATLTRVLFWCGLLLAAMETVKQLHLAMAANGAAYDWWYFPFQLCSVPLYLCLLMPVLKGRLREAVLTFMASYTFTGAVSALVWPEDFVLAAPLLTVHGFLWHGILLFISLLIVFTRSADLSACGFVRSTWLFLALSGAAVLINLAVEPLMKGTGLRHAYAEMFYLNPLHPSPQPLIGGIQEAVGNIPGLIFYAAAIIAISGAVDLVFCRCSHRHDADHSEINN